MTAEDIVSRWPEVRPDQARRIVSRLVGSFQDDVDTIAGLARRVRDTLFREARLDRLRVIDRRVSAVDPFAKYLFESTDGVRFESVRIPLERPRYSVCVSTQAGCAMGCAFCETGRMGFQRDLEPWEMVEQVLRIRAEARDRPVTGVVFQGQGEPLHNYENVIQATRILRSPSGARIGADRITISTVGSPAQIERYTAEGHPFRLILSLTSTDDERRASVIPSARRHSVEQIAESMRHHARARRSPLHIAWVLIGGFNTDPTEAARLRRLFPDVTLRVSLIDVNDPRGVFRPPEAEERGAFITALARQGIAFIRRYSGGGDIQAACGQLASTSCGGTSLAARYSPTT